MKNKKSILFLTSRMPYPPIGGDRLRNYWTLKILSKYFDVHLVTLTDQKPQEEFFKWAKDIGISYKVFQYPKYFFYFNALKSFLNEKPLQVNYYFFKRVKKYVQNKHHKFDILFASLIRTAEYVLDFNKPKILDITDSIALNYKHSYKKTTSIKWKIIYKLEVDKLLKYERECILKFNKTIFVNKYEMEYFNIPEKTELLPNGVNPNLFKYNKLNLKYKDWIVFFGKMNYQPNIDAVVWFIKEVLPRLNKNLKFAIVGAYPTKSIIKLSKKYRNVIVTGFVNDPYEIIKSSLCVVSPIQTGGGIQNKILESMALGTVNIVSSYAARPIGAVDGRDYLVIDDPINMANIINDIHKNPYKYNSLKENSRNFIKTHFSWDIYENKLINVIEEVLNNF